MNTTNNTEPYQSRAVIELLTVSNEYCLFLEKAEEYPVSDIKDFLQKVLPLLYLKGLLLPDINILHPEANERFVTAEQWEKIFGDLRDKFSDSDEYWTIDRSDETITSKESMADNFADIYQDLKDFVLLYQRNTKAAQEIAVAECKRLFKIHWGERISKVLPVLHTRQFESDNRELNDFWDL